MAETVELPGLYGLPYDASRKSLQFYQIYWREDQLQSLFPFAIPYLNQRLTVVFENEQIADLVPKSQADLIAVCSWALKKKYKPGLPPIGDLTIDRLQSDYDVMAFTRNTQHHDMLGALDVWHPGALDLLKRICASLGLQVPSRIDNPIYQNAFCAKREIYQAYVKEALRPAMQAMEGEFKAECWQDSNYYKLKNPGDDFASRVKQFLGTDYCPLHPFLLERLFSVWIQGKGLNVVIV